MATDSSVATFVSGYRGAVTRCLLFATLFVPVVMLPGFFFPYVTTRALFFRGAVEVAVLAALYTLLRERLKLTLRRDPVFISLVAFTFIGAVSALLSPAPVHSVYGDFERMGGVLEWLHWILYYALLRTALGPADWHRLFRVGAAVSAFVSLVGLAEILPFVTFPKDPAVAIPAMHSTVGNPGILAAYLLFGCVFALLAAAREKVRWPFLVIAAVDVLGMVLSQNRSIVVGMVAGAIAGSAIYARLTSGGRRWVPLSVAAALFALGLTLVSISALYPRSEIAASIPTVFHRSAQTRTTGEDAIRVTQWRVAALGVREHPLLGIGPENHRLLWVRHFDPETYETQVSQLYDRPHNTLLEVIETTGIPGFAAFLAAWWMLCLGIRGASRSQSLSPSETAILAGALLAYFVYLFFWFTDINSTTMWIALAAFVMSRRFRSPLVSAETGVVSSRANVVAYTAATLVLLWVLVTQVGGTLEAARAANLTQEPDRPTRAVLHDFGKLLDFPASQQAFTPQMLGSFLTSLVPSFPEIRNDPEAAAQVDSVLVKGLDVARVQASLDPANDRSHLHYAQLLTLAGRYYQDTRYFRAAIDELTTAIRLSPYRASSRLVLANVLLDLRDYRSAIAVARLALQIDPRLGETNFQMARAFEASGRMDSAFVYLERSEEPGFFALPEMYIAVAQDQERRAEPANAARILSRYIENKFAKRVWLGRSKAAREVLRGDIWIAGHLPLLFLSLGQSDSAAHSANALAALDSTWRPVVDRFRADIFRGAEKDWAGRPSLIACPLPFGLTGIRGAPPNCFTFGSEQSAPR